MKNYLLMGIMVVTLLASGSAWSQSANNGGGQPPQGNGGPPPEGMGGPNGGGGNFQEHKAMMIARINEHIADAQKRLACVQAATNHEALRACMPQRPEGGREGGPQNH